jgi:hypothetical protein
MSEENYSQDS